MKPIMTTMVLLLTVTIWTLSCNKGDKNSSEIIICPANGNPLGPTITNLQGSWQLAATKISPGGYITEWTPVNYYETIEWKDATTFIDKDKSTKEYQLTTLPGDTLAMMKYYTKGETDTATVYVAVFDSVVVINGLCTEQCSWKYIRSYNK